MINILVAGPKGLLPDLLISALSKSSQFRIIAHISSSDEITGALSGNEVSIALVGPMLSAKTEQMHMFGRLRTSFPRSKVIALLASRERDTVVEAFRQGARGILSLQHIEFDMVCRCLECVDSGQIWANNEEIGWVMNEFEEAKSHIQKLNIVDAAGAKLLTSREEDVVLLVMDGLTNRDVAAALSLSEHTIKNYMFHIFDKLGISSRTELIAYALNCSRKFPPAKEIPSRPEARVAAVAGRQRGIAALRRPDLRQVAPAVRRPSSARLDSSSMYPA